MSLVGVYIAWGGLGWGWCRRVGNPCKREGEMDWHETEGLQLITTCAMQPLGCAKANYAPDCHVKTERKRRQTKRTVTVNMLFLKKKKVNHTKLS